MIISVTLMLAIAIAMTKKFSQRSFARACVVSQLLFVPSKTNRNLSTGVQVPFCDICSIYKPFMVTLVLLKACDHLKRSNKREEWVRSTVN